MAGGDPPDSPRSSGPDLQRRLRVGALVLAGLLVAGAAGTWHLHRQVEARWSSHAPRLPSRVYAAPTTLYPGLPMTRARLSAELRARGYREAEELPLEAGRFRPVGDRLRVHLRAAELPPPRERREDRTLVVRFADGAVASMRDLRAGEQVAVAELAPHRTAVLLDERMVRREPVALDSVPEQLVGAVLAVEDRRFREHAGIDLRRILAAAVHDLRVGRLDQGASTITQQLVRSYWLEKDKTFPRKLREAIMALLLEASHEKDEILEAYLNEVYLGQAGSMSLAGVGVAARHYFGRDVQELELAESALLAGLIRAPNRYDPFRRPEAARARRDLVLRAMEREGLIDARQRAAAAGADLPTAPEERPVNAAPWYVDHVQEELEARYSREALEREGLRIWTALEPRIQRKARRAVQEGLEGLEARRPGLRREEDQDRLQAALVAVDPRTGDLLALVGGRGWGESQFNRATRARRQPGSLFKPFVLLAALADTADRRTLATALPDSSFAIESGGERWAPRNYDGREHGMVTLREAVVHSYNLAAARLGLEVGLEEVAATGRALGLPGPMRPLPSLSLGAFEATPLEMAGAYAALAGGGLRPRVLSVLAVAGPDGEPLASGPTTVRRVAPAGPVHLVNRTLQGVLDEGTAASAESLGYDGPAAGKTGTSSGYRDAWFVGYTPELVTVVWVGFDDGRSLGVDGAGAALPIWVRFMESLDRSFGDFQAPPGVTRARVRGPEDECFEELFLEGTVPEEIRCGRDLWPF